MAALVTPKSAALAKSGRTAISGRTKLAVEAIEPKPGMVRKSRSTAAAALALSTDNATAVEAGGAYSATGGATAGTNPSGNVLSNDAGNTPAVTGIQKFSDANATAVSASTTSSTGTSIAGQYGTLKIGADGSYVYTVDNTNATVQALRTTANTVNEVFTYTANDGTGASADGGLGSLDLHRAQRLDGSVTHSLYGSRLVPRIGISGQAGGAPTQSERQSCKGSDINGPTHCNSPADSCFVLNGGMSSSDKKALGNFSVLTQHLLPS